MQISRWHRRLVILLIAGVCSTANSAPRGFTVEDLVGLDRLSDPQLSADGKWVAYTLREADVGANRATSSIWLRSTDSGQARKMTSGSSSASSPRWSADGRSVYFLSSRSGSNQLWRIDLSGGEAQPVTSTPLDVQTYSLSPDGRSVALAFEVFVDCDDLKCSKKRLEEQSASKKTGQGFDSLFVRHWDSWKDGRRNQLYVARLSADGQIDEPRLVSRGIDGDVPTKPFGDDSDFAWSPDSQNIAFTARVVGREEAWSTNLDIFTAKIDGSEKPVNLTEINSAHDSHPLFSSDGKTLFYLSMRRPGFEADRLAIQALDLASGKLREIAPSWDISANNLRLSSNGKRLYATAQQLGERPLFSIDIASGKVRQEVGDGTIEGFDVAGDTLVFTRSSLTSTAQLYTLRGNSGKPSKMGVINDDKLADVVMGDFEQFSFKGWNGDTVYGYLVKPWNFVPGESYPVAFLIHGGPQGSMGNSFHYRWNPQTYAGRGMAAVFIDFHGSTGYGQAFTDSISQDWGGKPLEDLQKGWAYALEKFDFLDGDRACALGGSYGGYMVNWIAGAWPDAFKCLVSHAGIFDNRSMAYVTEEQWFSDYEFGGPQFQVPGNYEKHNPVNNVAKWRAPMLVIHGQLDYRVPLGQGLAAFTALQRLGIESRFVYFPDENHWILKPQNSIQWHHEVNAWLERWTAEP